VSHRVSYIAFVAAYLFIATVALFGAPVGERGVDAAPAAFARASAISAAR
jgi:hypothetical protein